MMLGTVQISGDDIGDAEIRDICESLKSNSIRLLSLRSCRMEDINFRKLVESLKENNSLAHLNLNLGVVNSKDRATCLAEGIKGNAHITTILLHGNPLGDEGMSILAPAFEFHPKLQSIDVGDCQLGDDAMQNVCSLIKSRENKQHLKELTLTGNRNISQTGWAQLAMAIANHSRLTSLFLDYNNIGDFGAGLLAVALASSKYLQVLDLEGTNITDVGADLLCDSIESHNVTLRELSLAENEITDEILSEIKECLQENIHSQSTQK
jgi:Ran GTPase-activating protein (RanGAP) involved in mRNA processing and transport